MSQDARRDHPPQPHGRGRTWRQTASGLWLPGGAWHSNLMLRSWGAIVGNLLRTGGRSYRLSTMYLEYENTAAPGDAVAPPAYGRDPADGLAYYNALADSTDRDYLRVPVFHDELGVSDSELYPDGNIVHMWAQTTGISGVHGKPFSSAANSRVFGAASVATPNAVDATADLICNRLYFDAADQVDKPDSGQVAVEIEIQFD